MWSEACGCTEILQGSIQSITYWQKVKCAFVIIPSWLDLYIYRFLIWFCSCQLRSMQGLKFVHVFELLCVLIIHIFTSVSSPHFIDLRTRTLWLLTSWTISRRSRGRSFSTITPEWAPPWTRTPISISWWETLGSCSRERSVRRRGYCLKQCGGNGGGGLSTPETDCQSSRI